MGRNAKRLKSKKPSQPEIDPRVLRRATITLLSILGVFVVLGGTMVVLLLRGADHDHKPRRVRSGQKASTDDSRSARTPDKNGTEPDLSKFLRGRAAVAQARKDGRNAMLFFAATW